MIIEKFLRPHTGKFIKIEHYIMLDEKNDMLSGCGICLSYELENESLFNVNTKEESFIFGGVTYFIKADGLYSDSVCNVHSDKLKKRNKLEKQYT